MPRWPSAEVRFWRKVNKTDGCWVWVSTRWKSGYGRFQRFDRSCSAHRVSWEFANGEIPSGMCVCHHCDNPACVRPGHLFLGTKADNAADAVAKRRQVLGAKNGRAKLNDESVREILKSLSFGQSRMAVARQYGVSARTVRQILAGDRWKHVERGLS